MTAPLKPEERKQLLEKKVGEKKLCYRCKKIKPITDFWKNKKKNDGRFPDCKVCRRAYERTRKHRNKWNNLHRERVNRAVREYNARNPEKAKARQIFHTALLKGDIIRQPCMICGKDNAHGHHDDYTKPLAVKWLCREHHEDVHSLLIDKRI